MLFCEYESEPLTRRAAGVARADLRRARALLLDGPVQRERPRLFGIGTRLLLNVDLFEKAEVVEPLVVATHEPLRDDHAGMEPQLAADHDVLRDRVARDLNC